LEDIDFPYGYVKDIEYTVKRKGITDEELDYIFEEIEAEEEASRTEKVEYKEEFEDETDDEEEFEDEDEYEEEYEDEYEDEIPNSEQAQRELNPDFDIMPYDTEEQKKIKRVVKYVRDICKECKNKGLKISDHNGSEKEYSAVYYLQMEVHVKRSGIKALLNELKDKANGHKGHWTYINSLGLINRGFCPYCGAEPITKDYTFTVYGYTIFLCKFCYEKGKAEQKPSSWFKW